MNNILKKMIYFCSAIIFIVITLLFWKVSTSLVVILPILLSMILPILLHVIKKCEETLNTKCTNKIAVWFIKRKEKIFVLAIFILAFIIRMIAVFSLKIEPVSDFTVLLDASINFSKGENIMNDSLYFQRWSYQTGFVLYQALILKIFNSILVLHVFDCVFTSVICVLIYIIGKLSCEKTNKLPTILYTLYVYAIAYTGVLTNQHIFTFISLVAIVIILKETKIDKLKYLIVGVLLGIANILRPEGIVILSAIILYEILNITDKKEIRQILIRLLILLVSYISITQISSILVKVSNINQYGLKNNNTLWKFVCGSDYETGGGYSKAGEAIIDDKDKEKEFIIQNYGSLNFEKAIDFIKRKIQNFWLCDDYNWVFVRLHEEGQSEIYNRYIRYDLIVYGFILIAAIYSIIAGIKNNKQHDKKILLIFILLINFAVYLLIEVQHRYSYMAKIILFILAGDGVEQMIKYIEILLDKGRKYDKRKDIKV